MLALAVSLLKQKARSSEKIQLEKNDWFFSSFSILVNSQAKINYLPQNVSITF